ncbi:MAG: trimethylamine methyltransferase family protein [Deltaproteobacteria bacterium]|nr:trimethylamine methyltransferase family protein [Deltaproteobacteria bacterium]
MQLHLNILSEEEKVRIHADSLKILAEVGVKFMSDKALDVLDANGASINRDTRVAKIPEEMVNQALNTAPKSFVLGARNPEFDFALPSTDTGYTLDGAATFAIDFMTGERRNAMTEDLVSSLRIFEEMPLATVVWPNVLCSDTTDNYNEIRPSFTSFIHSSKHIQNELHHPEEVPFLIEGLTAILGSEDRVKERKIFSVCYCTIPPLTHDREMCDTYLDLVQFHVPILAFPMPAAGSTGPASLYSDTAVANAEGLSTLVLYQMAEPGTPIILGHAAGITNFSIGTFLEGAPETTLINAALGEMARFYGLPNTQAGCLSDAKQPGAQAIMEKTLSTLPLVLSGVDLINGIGELDTSQLLVLEQIVVDHEIALMCQRYKDGIDVCDEKDLYADVKGAQPGGHFLTQPGTLRYCRDKEFFRPALCDRNTYEHWETLGRPDLYSKAREKVEQILAGHLKNALDDDILGKLEAIQRKADKALKSNDHLEG